MKRFAGKTRAASLLLLSCALITGASGCATLRGSQDGLVAMRARSLPLAEDALRKFHLPDDQVQAREGMTREAYRDYVVALYQLAIDERYKRFVDQLQSSDRGTALGFDVLQLGLSGATVLAAQSAVDELATAATVTAGLRASVDKRLFFERTIPAVVAAMDAERASIKAEIALKRGMPADAYTLDDGMDTLGRLVDAGRVDRALGRITRSAESERSRAEVRLNAITAACDDITEADAGLNAEFRKFVETAPANAAAAASALNVALQPGQPSRPALMRAFANVCGSTVKTKLLASIKANVGGQ